VYFRRFVHAEGFFRQFKVYFYGACDVLAAFRLIYAFIPFVELPAHWFNADVHVALYEPADEAIKETGMLGNEYYV